MTKQEFIETNGKIANAVIRQAGGWSNFKDNAQGMVYSVDGGFSGFIYYTETVKFYERNKTAILELLKEQANDIGEPVITMIASFNCLDVSQDEILDFFALGKKSEEYTTIANALAWFAGEEIARRYCDALEG